MGSDALAQKIDTITIPKVDHAEVGRMLKVLAVHAGQERIGLGPEDWARMSLMVLVGLTQRVEALEAIVAAKGGA